MPTAAPGRGARTDYAGARSNGRDVMYLRYAQESLIVMFQMLAVSIHVK